MKVTADLLAREGACLEARELFNEVFGVEAELNEENLKIYININRFAFKDIHWLSSALLNYKYRIIFREYYSNVYRKINDADKISLAVGKKLIELHDQQEREDNMYVVQHLKRKYYAMFESNSKVTWTFIRSFATHFDSREDAEAKIAQVGLERDDYAIIKTNGN